MGLGRSTTLRVDIVTDARGVGSGVDAAERRFDRFGGTLGKFGKIAAVGAAGGLLAIGGALGVGVKQAADYERQIAQTNAVLKSTHGVAGVTADTVKRLGDEIEGYSTIGDDAVRSGANMLLTFTNIRNEAGKGNDVFNQTVRTMADMSTALGQDTKSSALQLGKALNDPVKGVTALQRVGVSFTASQREQIKTLVEHGRTMDAQKLILRELGTEFGGSAKAAGDTFGGSIEKLKNSAGDLLRDALLPTLPALTSLVGTIAKDVLPGVMNLGARLGKNLGPALKQVGGFISRDVVPFARDMHHWFVEKIAPGIVRYVTPIVRGIGSAFKSVGGAIHDNRDELGKIGNVLKNVGEFMAQKVLPILGKLSGTGFKVLGETIGIVVDGIGFLVRAIETVVGWLQTLKEWADKVAGPLGKVGSVVGKIGGALNPFGADYHAGHVAGLTGGGRNMGAFVGGFARASLADEAFGFAGLAGAAAQGAVVIIDRRSFPMNVRVDGALDGPSVARQVERLLADHARRVGRASSFGV